MRFANPNPNRRDGFSNSNREARVPYLNHGTEGGYQNPQEYRMKVDIPSFSGYLDIKSFMDWIYEVDKFLTWLIFSWRNKSNLWHKLKGGGFAWSDQL